ncbi:hypothetical protein KUTeg_016984 [Tegillarca granosa]|uniref:Lysosomal dipeptide transporter MFSD1 n=1 Tax=Tegillarca granosa TaxID=220873 RepID=A0ABQ9EME9_TEGGR|nr:hypothetical protein KUTeg_016984 [Tegillarca granosa]
MVHTFVLICQVFFKMNFKGYPIVPTTMAPVETRVWEITLHVLNVQVVWACLLMITIFFMLFMHGLGVFIFSFLCVLGSSTFAVGAMFKGTPYMLPIMLIGRLLFGSGNGSLTIVQNRITAYWFRNKELAMAFGITLAFSRLGSVLNFFLTQNFALTYGLQWTLWGGAMLCGLGFISAIVVGIMDVIGIRQLGDEENLKNESKKLKVSDIKHFSASYWMLALTIMFFYNGVFPFVADARVPISEKLTRWRYVMIFLLANTLACVTTTVFLNLNDKRKGGILNLSRRQKEDRVNKIVQEEKVVYEDSDEEQPLLRGERKHVIN